MKCLLMMFAFAASCASAEMFKCFDGVRPKYTYQNMPCEDSGLKTAKIITNKDAMVGSADFSGYKREARERAKTSEMLERDHIERRNIDYQRSGASQRQDTSGQCAWLVSEKRSIIAQQRQRSTPYLQEAFNDVTKRMQKIDCLGS